MRRRRSQHHHRQGDLFEVGGGATEDQNRVRDLDGLIAQALKRNDYAQAKTLTQEQERLIQKLVESGDGVAPSTEDQP